MVIFGKVSRKRSTLDLHQSRLPNISFWVVLGTKKMSEEKIFKVYMNGSDSSERRRESFLVDTERVRVEGTMKYMVGSVVKW